MESDAVPPSSPPHAPHATIPDTSSSPFFEPRYNAYSLKSSSPPPLFSSDDSCESADLVNYESPRIFKNKRKGAWWNNESAHSPLKFKKAKMTRNYDSGVYMMSDSTDSSESLLPPHKAPFDLDGTSDELPQEDSLPQEMGDAENLFCTKLYEGLDKNSQTYDFSGCDFNDSDIGRIGELTSVIKSVPDPGTQLPAEGQYRSMVPELYVNLSDNKLRLLTPSLFNVQNLTTLNLVNNDIEELPAQIGQLRNLRELNISRNNIKWLPFELLGLFQEHEQGRLEILGHSGVPWLQPNVDQVQSYGHYIHACNLEGLYRRLESDPARERSVWSMRLSELLVLFPDDLSKESPKGASFGKSSGISDVYQMNRRSRDNHQSSEGPPRYVSRTTVTYFDQEGTLIKGSPKQPSSTDDDFTVITETIRGAHGVPTSWFTPPHTKPTKSLLTLALESALAHKDQDGLTVSDLRDYIADPVPTVADALLKQAELNNSGGHGEFRSCHTCKKDYVMARAEWIEWWRVKALVVLPFKRKVCSWACVPETMLHRPEKELIWEDAESYKLPWSLDAALMYR
jgi:hypothetical protein